MPPQIPYTGAPAVRPEGVPAVFQSGRGGDPGAFGAIEASALGIKARAGETAARAAGGEANALGALGEQIAQTGNVLATHSLFLQQRFNEAQAKESFLAAQERLGQLETEYRSLEGKNAVAAYPKFVEGLKALRQESMQAAPNKEIARLFDQEFSRRMVYSINDGARYAGAQNKKYISDVNQALVTTAVQNAVKHAGSDEMFDDSIRQIRSAVRSQGREEGSGEETIVAIENRNVSEAWVKRLAALSLTDPMRANALFTANRDAIDGAAQVQIQAQIHQRLANVEARRAADEIIAMQPEKGQNRLTFWMKEAEKKAEAQAPNDSIYKDALLRQVREGYNQIRAQEIEVEQARVRARQALVEAREDRLDKVFQGVKAGNVTADQIITDPVMSVSNKRAALDFLDKSLKESDRDKRTYGANFPALLRQMYSTGRVLSNEEIVNQIGDGLTVAGAEKLRAEAISQKSIEGQADAAMKREFLQQAEKEISGEREVGGISIGRDPKGRELFLKFNSWFLDAYEKGRQEGKSPRDLLDPDGKDSLWKGVARFRRDPTTFMSDMMKEVEGLPGKVDIGKATRKATDADDNIFYEVGGKWYDKNGVERK